MKTIIMLLLVLAAVGCSPDPESSTPTQQTVTAMTTAQGFDAVHRDMPFADEACHDSIQGFLIHNPADLEFGENTLPAGWLVNSKVHFYPLENGTWFIGNWSAAEFVLIAPDTTRLTCRQFIPG